MVRHVLHRFSFLVFNIGLNAKLQKIPQTRPNIFRFYNFLTQNTPPRHKETEAVTDFRFRPDSTDLDNLTSKAFGRKVSFGKGYYQTETGNKAPKIPLAAATTPEP